MQEIKKRRIVIASVLKPVDDTRMFEKMGESLSPHYEVHIIGFPTSSPERMTREIKIHPLPPFKRLSVQRVRAAWQALRIIIGLEPDLLIITTHELLLPAMAAKGKLGCKVIYDVRENYRRNILYTNSFPTMIRPMLSGWVGVKEKLARTFIDHYLLAEKGYEREMKFPPKHVSVLENRIKHDNKPRAQKKFHHDSPVHLLFSGTISESTGVFGAVELAKALHHLNNAVHLTIIGYCALPATLDQLKITITGRSFITLVGGDQLVPHSKIMDAIHAADFGIICYPPNPATVNSIPTKLYEYLGSQLPILLINHQPWVEICEPYPAAVVFDMVHFDAMKMMDEMISTRFYQTSPVGILWEGDKLLTVVNEVLNRS